ncbi:hypothetical protein NX059_011404 [Plenodomus lindquistii]|nr:hypothetical protein NX059_011404 [Plenodomus lindquistii]
MHKALLDVPVPVPPRRQSLCILGVQTLHLDPDLQQALALPRNSSSQTPIHHLRAEMGECRENEEVEDVRIEAAFFEETKAKYYLPY